MIASKKILTSGFILLLSFTCCKDKRNMTIPNDGVEVIKINLDKNQSSKSSLGHTFSIKDKVAKIELIPLETNQECLISEISKLLFHNNTFIISDKQTNKILQFDDKGKFIKTIGSQGRGPLEYSHIWDIEIDKNTGELDVLCISNPVTFKCYSISTNNAYSKTFKNILGYHFIYLDENTLLIFDTATQGKYDYELMIVDKSGQIKERYFHNPYVVGYSAHPERSFHEYNDIISFIRENDNVVYQISKDTHALSERYIFDFGKYNLPEDYKNLFYTNFQEYQLIMNDYVGINTVLETDDYLFFDFGIKNRGFSAFYSKTAKITRYGDFNDNILDDIIMSPIATIDNEFISAVEPLWIFKVSEDVEDKTSEAWINFLEENPIYNELYNKFIDENSNPILVRYHLKP